jgi:hypothetical protein
MSKLGRDGTAGSTGGSRASGGISGSAGKNVHSVGFSTNEPRIGDAKYNSFVERYLKRSAETTNMPQPANVCNTSLNESRVKA